MALSQEEYERLKQFYIDVKESLTLQDYRNILDMIEIPIAYEKHDEWRLYTGCHNEISRDGGANLQFKTTTRHFICYSGCNCSYDIYTLLVKRFEMIGTPKTNIQCLKWICNYKGIEFNFNTQDKKQSNRFNWEKGLSKYSSRILEKEEEVIYNKSVLKKFKELYHEDWIDYGISEETMSKYNIRWYSYRNQITIPCYNECGGLVGIRVRNMNEELIESGIPRYMPLKILDGTEYTFHTNKYLYGLNFNRDAIKRKREVWLVEAEKSVLKANDWFGDENVCVGLFGSNLSNENVKKLIELGVDKVIIMIDSDYKNMESDEFFKFEEKVMKLYAQLKPYVNTIEVLYNNLDYDAYKFSPFDFTRDEFYELWKSKQILS